MSDEITPNYHWDEETDETLLSEVEETKENPTTETHETSNYYTQEEVRNVGRQFLEKQRLEELDKQDKEELNELDKIIMSSESLSPILTDILIGGVVSKETYQAITSITPDIQLPPERQYTENPSFIKADDTLDSLSKERESLSEKAVERVRETLPEKVEDTPANGIARDVAWINGCLLPILNKAEETLHENNQSDSVEALKSKPLSTLFTNTQYLPILKSHSLDFLTEDKEYLKDILKITHGNQIKQDTHLAYLNQLKALPEYLTNNQEEELNAYINLLKVFMESLPKYHFNHDSVSHPTKSLLLDEIKNHIHVHKIKPNENNNSETAWIQFTEAASHLPEIEEAKRNCIWNHSANIELVRSVLVSLQEYIKVAKDNAPDYARKDNIFPLYDEIFHQHNSLIQALDNVIRVGRYGYNEITVYYIALLYDYREWCRFIQTTSLKEEFSNEETITLFDKLKEEAKEAVEKINETLNSLN